MSDVGGRQVSAGPPGAGPSSTGPEPPHRSMLDASSDMLWVLDAGGTVLRVSDEQQAILGYRSGELNGRPMLALVHPDDTPLVQRELERVGRGQVARFDLRYRLARPDGRWTTVATKGRAVTEDDWGVIAIVAASRDVTGEVREEQKLLLAVSNAEQASQAKSEFLSRMSHELRTPLNSVLGFAQLLQMDELLPEQEEAVEHILRAGRHLLGLIDEVLDIARIEMGHLDLVMEPVELRALVADAVALTSPLADRAAVSVSIAGDLDPLSCVYADKQRLLQVLLNLLSNAVKYNSRGGKVRVTCEDLGAGHIGVAVSDTGVGIREEDMGKLFEPFERLGAEQLGIEGTGVGLTIAKNLVERMGGVLEVFSEVGKGSTFEVALRETTDRKEPDHVRAGPGAPEGTQSMCVLLIEDNLANLTLIEKALGRREGVRLLAAMHGTLGLDLAREHHPDLVLLDLHLPDQSGIEVLKRLRGDPSTSDIPVIVVSADRSSGQADAMRELGAVDYLSKPFDLRDLLHSVDSALGTAG
jgi:PAS domain S-box-containing protein